ncbi:MAG: DUF6457 domain-containing protein [Nocardioides sp.]
MNLHDWIDELCDVLDIDADVDEGLILDLTKVVADNVVRAAAPISAYLIGIAVGRADADPGGAERYAALAQGLAERWDRPGGSALLEADEVEEEVDLDFGDELEDE